MGQGGWCGGCRMQQAGVAVERTRCDTNIPKGPGAWAPAACRLLLRLSLRAVLFPACVQHCRHPQLSAQCTCALPAPPHGHRSTGAAAGLRRPAAAGPSSHRPCTHTWQATLVPPCPPWQPFFRGPLFTPSPALPTTTFIQLPQPLCSPPDFLLLPGPPAAPCPHFCTFALTPDPSLFYASQRHPVT